MTLKVVVPERISREIKAFGLPREVLVRMLTRIHSDLPKDTPFFRSIRLSDSDRMFQYRFVVLEGKTKHLFTFAVDDTTASEHLIIEGITHHVRETRSE